MDKDKSPIKLASDNPGHKPKAWARTSPGGVEQLVCGQCNGSTWIRGEEAPMVKNMKVMKGAPVMICVTCLANGEVVTRPTK